MCDNGIERITFVKLVLMEATNSSGTEVFIASAESGIGIYSSDAAILFNN